eukprot:jgi/Psemu1/55196/gm1.55196_g
MEGDCAQNAEHEALQRFWSTRMEGDFAQDAEETTHPGDLASCPHNASEMLNVMIPSIAVEGRVQWQSSKTHHNPNEQKSCDTNMKVGGCLRDEVRRL